MSPESVREAPRRQGEAFAALRARLESAGFTVQDDEPGEAYIPHARFEREWQRYPDGRLRFEEPTDCAGEMRIIEKMGPNWMLCCEACEAEWTVKVPADRLREYLLERTGVPEMFAGKGFEKDEPAQEPTVATCRAWVRGFRDGPIPAVALWGQPGRGKSHLLSVIVETLVRNHQVEVIYRSMVALLGELREAIAAGAFEGTYSRMANVPVLALDDLGAERMTEASKDWLAGLVDHRYSKELPLLVATNIPPQAWPDVFGDRTASRLQGMCVPLKLEGPDRRAQGVQTALSMAAIAGE